MNALKLENFVAGYDLDLPIVKDVSLNVDAGESIAILGPNGAGKSTLIKAIAGQASCFSGTVWLDGSDITGVPSHELARRGLGFVPQTENIFTQLTILENLQIASELMPPIRRTEQLEKMFTMFPDLGSRPSALAGSLSGGQRQMLAAARALLTEPKVLILDEPSAGLSPKLVAQVFETLRTISESGVTLILVEQNVRAALQLATRSLVLVDGALAHDGPSSELKDGAMLGQLFLGSRSQETHA